MSDVSLSSSNHCISEGVIKAIQHYCQRRDAFFSPVPAAENKTERLDSFSQSSEDKTSQENERKTADDRNTTKKEEDDFVDVVQLDG